MQEVRHLPFQSAPATFLRTGLGHPPLAFLYEVLFGASQSFLNPIGYHTTNLVDFRPCRYRFLDVTRYGLPHTLIMTLLVPFLLCRHFNL